MLGTQSKQAYIFRASFRVCLPTDELPMCSGRRYLALDFGEDLHVILPLRYADIWSK